MGKKSNIIKALEELDKEDIYSLILFTFYKLKDISEYSILGELVYLLDNKSFTNFLSYFEGQTIKVPKISDLTNIVNALLFYERKINSNFSDDEILASLDIPKGDKQQIINTLNLINGIVEEYDFKRSKKDE